MSRGTRNRRISSKRASPPDPAAPHDRLSRVAIRPPELHSAAIFSARASWIGLRQRAQQEHPSHEPERGIGLARGDESVELIGAVEVEHGLSAQDQRRRHSEVLAGRLDVAGFGSFAVPSFLWAFTGHRVTQSTGSHLNTYVA